MANAYNSPMKVAFTPSWNARNNPAPRAKNPKDWQTVNNGAGFTAKQPRVLANSSGHHALNSVMHSSAVSKVTASGADTGILGTNHIKAGGHAGHGQ